MLDQFYSYLSKRILEFFKENPLRSGAKYNVQFETEEQVKNLYRSLQDNEMYEEFHYIDDNGEVKYSSYSLNFNGIKLIIAATIDNIQPDFLTRLRNMVGTEKGYENKAILFIHNTTLDSIIGGTEAFNKEGMPYHIDSIQKDIKKKLVDSEFSEVDKAIIDLDFKRKKEEIFKDTASVFEFKELLEIINGTCIEKEQYKNFGLFYDSKLKDYTGKELTKRLNNNSYYYEKVNEIHTYGNPDTQLERYFDDSGVEKLKKDNWREIDYTIVKKSIDNRIKEKPLEYLGSGLEWDKPEGNSKAKSRIRNIIVFNENRDESIQLEFSFDDYIKNANITTEGNLQAVASGKKIRATVKNDILKSCFHKITYKNEKNIKFEFKIVVLNCSEKVLDDIKSKFTLVIKKKEQYIAINTNDSLISFNPYSDTEIVHELLRNNDSIDLQEDTKVSIKISNDFKYENDIDLITFKLNIDNRAITFGILGTNEKIGPIDGLGVWKLKREKKCNFRIVGDNKIQHGTKDFFTRDEFRRNLELEKQIVSMGGFYYEDTVDGLKSIELEIDENVHRTYNDIVDYFRTINNIPSLTYLNDDMLLLFRKYINAYLEALDGIEEGSYLTKKQKNLFKVGLIKREIEDREVLLTPLHPLNIAYQVKLIAEINDEVISEEIIKKFTGTYLLPYIIDEDDTLYIPMEQNHSPEWKYYVDEKLPRYKSSRDFVAKLVTEKIEEFIGHFKYMFNMGGNAPIRINLINTGDSKEILQGIFKYYVKQLKSKKDKVVLPIDIFIYSNKSITNAFEEVAFNDDIDSIKSLFGLDLNVDGMSEEDVMNLYREKVCFYSKKLEQGIEYAHITFFEMSNEAKKVTSNMDDIASGVIYNGLISGVPSVFLGDSYRTGFGTKYAKTDSDLMKIAIKLNALNSASSGEPYNSNQCKAISIPNKSKEILEEIYNASHWITFIDPKVDLNFFKNDPDAKDLLIIHYSDQYTTAGGYDAITVTRKSAPYQRVIEEFLTMKDVQDAEKYSPEIINMFNAINGDWLLRLLSSKSYMPKEKLSILSAVKLALAEFRKDNIIWVPISLEEVLRVSGGAGLKQSEGFFSAKNLGFERNGATSDDILLVGIETVNDEVFVHYYPIEVKIGGNDESYIGKGIEQAKSTKKIFKEVLLPNENGKLTTTQKIYRNFLMQLVITSAEKLNLYNVCTEQEWKSVIDSDIRQKLLNEEYEISDSIDESIGEAAVISFKRGLISRDTKMEDKVMIIEMSEDDGINFITKSVGEIRKIVGGIEVIGTSVGSKGITDEVDATENIDIDEEGGNEVIEVVIDPIVEKKPIEVGNERNMEILFGENQSNKKELYWYPNNTDKVFHTNTGIIGTMGTGKTQFTKSLIAQLYREGKYNLEGKPLGILIFDYKGDYNKNQTEFIEATNAKVFELYHLPFNPLSLVTNNNPKPMLPLHTANGLKETLAKAFGLGIKQETLLRDLIVEAYEARGIRKGDRSTWNKPAPTLKDVYDMYVSKEDLKEDSLYAAFSNLVDFEIFEPDRNKTKSLFDLIDGVTVIDLSGYDPGIQNLVVAITLDLFYTQMQSHGHSKINGSIRQLNKMILVDEADNFLSKNFASLKKILKEGREFGVGTILSTQLLSHFSTGENDYANYILTWVIHNVAELNYKEIKYIFNTQNKQDDEILFNQIKSLKKHYSLVKMGDSDRAIFMKDKAFWELDK